MSRGGLTGGVPRRGRLVCAWLLPVLASGVPFPVRYEVDYMRVFQAQ